MDIPAVDPALVARFAALVEPGRALDDPGAQAAYLAERRNLFHGNTPLVLRPGTVAEVAAIVRLAAETGTAIVAQSGNTGLVGGGVPDGSGREILLSLDRLDRIRAVDAADNTLVAEAGVILDKVHQAADAVGRIFPLTLAAQGSCRIGGNVSTNAGGTNVLAYGNTRQLVLGLEVVLATGEVWNGLRRLHKDNSGYDLKQLFIGGEGTLGIVTAAVLRLFPKPAAREVAFVALESPAKALALFERLGEAGPLLTGFELMAGLALEFGLKHLPGSRRPFAGVHPWYVLIEVSSPSRRIDARGLMEALLAEAIEAGIAEDAALAETLAQQQAFWGLRHGMSEVQGHEGGSIKHDISVPIEAIPAFLAEAIPAVEALVPGCRPVPFGHMGDGNLHFNVSQPVGADKAAYLARWEEMNAVVHAIVQRYEGSIAAEHGVGRLKAHLLPGVKAPVELAMMRQVKAVFDPKGILNPGRILERF